MGSRGGDGDGRVSAPPVASDAYPGECEV